MVERTNIIPNRKAVRVVLSNAQRLGPIKPNLDKATTERLSRALVSEDFHSLGLNLWLCHKIRQTPYYFDLELLTDDKLSQITTISKANLRRLYLDKMAPIVEQIYEEVLSGERKIFPHGLWTGWQGQLNFIICFRYLLRKKCNLIMQRNPRTIDSRLFKENQAKFLQTACGKADWSAFISQYKLRGGFKTLFNNSIINLMRAAFPWAFDLSTPEGKHLHHDDFRQNDLFAGKDGKKLARIMLDHRLRKHLGFEIDQKTGKLDKQLLWQNHAKTLAKLSPLEKQFCSWKEAIAKEGLDRILLARPEFHGRFGELLKWRYPWAFDLTKPEGKHLHVHDFDHGIHFVTDQELREALLHAAAPEGWTTKELPAMVTQHWLISVGLKCLIAEPKLTLFRRAFPDEFAQGIFTAADFSHQNCSRWLTLPQYRKIKPTKAGTTTYGLFIYNGVKYHFTQNLMGWAVRVESAEHAVIYKPIRIFDRGEQRKTFEPVMAFRLIPGPSTYHSPEIEEFDADKHPSLSTDTKTALLSHGLGPQHLTSGHIQALRNRGANNLTLFLQRAGLIR